MTAGWLQDAFRTFVDVGEVEIRRHHLRAGPHDSRGRCGCHINDCSAFRAHERERGNRVSIEYRIEARKIALSLAASAMNQSLDGPRRIDGEGMWPAANPAAAETVQRRLALPEVGVAFRAPSRNGILAATAAQRTVAEEAPAPWPFSWSDPYLGARRPLKLATGWRVYQIERGTSRAWMIRRRRTEWSAARI